MRSKGESIMCGKIFLTMNSIFSTAGVMVVCITLLTMLTKMDFVDIGAVSMIVGCFVGVTSFIRWGKTLASVGSK